MSDITNDVEADFIVDKIDGKEVKFSVVSPYDRAALLREWREQYLKNREGLRLQKKENLKDAGIAGEQYFAEMQNFDDETNRDISEQTWIDYVNNPVNEHRLLVTSLEVFQPGRGDELARKATIRSSIERRAKLAGLELRRPEPAQGDPLGPNPSTLPEMVYGTPEGEPTGPTQNAA